MSNIVDMSDIEKRIAARIDTATGTNISVSDMAGGLVFQNVGQVMDFARMMAIGGIAVRAHLRGNVGACLAICVQALEWRFSPYAVANKSYSVNNQLAYEAQLIAAVILTRAPIAEGEYPDYVYAGSGPALECEVSIKLKGGKTLRYKSPTVGDIKVKNSPLWTSDPEQQLGYYSIRAWARRHMPHIILGVFARDELPDDEDRINRARDVTPRGTRTIQGRLDQLAGPAASEPAHDPLTGEIIAGEQNTETSQASEDGTEGEAPRDGAAVRRNRPAAGTGASPATMEPAAKDPPPGAAAGAGTAADQRSADEEALVDAPSSEEGFPGDAPSALKPIGDMARDALIERLRAVAREGARKLKFALAKLSKDEHRILTGSDQEGLFEIANHADMRGAGG